MQQDKKHRHSVLELGFLLAKKEIKNNPIALGNEMVRKGLDWVFDGFWIWAIGTEIEYYSPRFRKSLGFENEDDFPNVPKSWQGQIEEKYLPRAIKDFEAHLKDPDYEYHMIVEYRKKNGGLVKLICSGTIVNRDDSTNLMMLGTHKIVA